MIGAAKRRHAGLGLATALVLTLAAGSGCGGPPAHSTPEQGHSHVPMAASRSLSVRVSLPRVRGGLPWPVALRIADGRYVIARSGAIHPLPATTQRPRAPVHHPAGFVWVDPHAGMWAMMRRGHLLILRNRAVIWHSAARYPVRDAAHMDNIVAGRPGIAFEVHQFGPWFMAGWHTPEHRVAAAGWPEMWTRSGNLIGVLHRSGSPSFGFAVFSPSGARLATLATGLSVAVADQRDDDPATGTFWYLTGNGDLVRTDGVATTAAASTRALGLTGIPQVGILGGG